MSRFELRAVIRYLTLKNPSFAEIATELQSVYGMDALKYSTVSKWRLRFQDGSHGLFDLARSETPSRSHLAAPIESVLQQFPFIACKILCCKLKIGKATWLRALHVICTWKISVYAMFRIHWKLIRNNRGSNSPGSFSRYLNKINNMSLNIYKQGKKASSFLDISIIRAGPQIQMTCLKFRSKNLIRKVPHFDYLG
jgi:hypothetical protein